MVTLNPSNKAVTPRSKLTLILLLFAACLTMGAKLTKQSIEDFRSVAGPWKGSSTDPLIGASISIKLVIREDGSYDVTDHTGMRTGMLKLREGKIIYEGFWTTDVTLGLYEGNGKRIMKGYRADGGAVTLKSSKKKDKRKRKKKN